MRFAKSQLKFPIITFAGLSLICSFAASFFGANIKNCFIFSAYQICVIFIPGVAATLLLHRNGKIEIDLLAFICISYSLGYALQVLLYFVAVLCGLRHTIPVIISVLLFIESIAVVFKSSRNRSVCVKNTEIKWTVLFAVFLVLVIFAYCGNYVPPVMEGESVSFHADALYWIENAAALTKTFPPAELRMSGTVLYYHYFASAYLAIANIITGIDVFSLGYAFYPLGKCFIFFGGLYELSKLFQKKKRKQFFFLFILLFTTGLERYSIANYVAHILVLPFGFDIGFGYGAWFLAFLIRQFKENKFDACACIITVLCFLMCAGHKAPVALIYLLPAGIICLSWLHGREIKKAFLYGIPLLVCFAAVMIVCVGFLQNGESRVNAGSFSHVATLRASPLFQNYEAVALSREPGITGMIPVLFLYFKLMLALVLAINPVILFLFIHGIADSIISKKMEVLDAALVSAALFGVFMGLFNAQEGVSQMYYTLSSYLPALIFGVRHFVFDGKLLRKTVAVCAAALTIIQCFWFFHDSGVAKAAVSGFKTITGIRSRVAETIAPYSMQQTDYEALAWVRDHTDANALLMSDRSVLCGLDNYMFHGTFSERQMYLEGDRYFYGTYLEERERRRNIIASLYDNDGDAYDAAVQEGVKYIIQTKWLTPDYEGTGCSPVYETDTMRIWKIDG